METENMTLDILIDKIDFNHKESETYIHLLNAMSDWGEDDAVVKYFTSIKLFLGIEEINIKKLERGIKKIKLDHTNVWELESISELIIFLKLKENEKSRIEFTKIN